MPALAAEELLARLSNETGFSQQEIQDFLSLPADKQMEVAQGYSNLSWVKDPDRLAEVLTVLTLLSTVVGAINPVAGAVAGGVVGAIQAIKTLSS